MKQIFFIFFLSFILTAISCEKESGPTTANGTVVDKTTNTPVADAEVGLFEKEPGIFANLGAKLLQTKFSDINGNCSFDFIARKDYVYYLHAIKNQYWNDQSNNISYLHDTGGETDVTVYLQPEGYLEIRVHNVNEYDASDYIIVNDLYSTFYGNSVDTTETITIFGNESQTITWFISSEGILSAAIHAEIYCPAFDTTYFEILY